jgi:GTP-binding protein Era
MSAFRSGFVGLVGRPNVGKSTILNYYLRQKLAATSPKPQTTRERILGVLHLPEAQVAFLDSPGLHRPRNTLGRIMHASAKDVLESADILVAVIDAKAGLSREDERVFGLLKQYRQCKLLALNKADLVHKPALLPLLQQCEAYNLFKELIPISAYKGTQMDVLLKAIMDHLPLGPAWYPPEQVTDQTDEAQIREFIREPILHAAHAEVPHAVAVIIDHVEDKGDIRHIHASIIVEREGQKAIIIGKQGGLLKKIGQAARQSIESKLKCRIFLKLWVKVVPEWRSNERILRSLGYIKNE